MGPLASLAQRREVLARSRTSARSGSRHGDADDVSSSMGARPREGRIRRAGAAALPRRRKAHGRSIRSRHSGLSAPSFRIARHADAIALARRGGGSLVGSVFTADDVSRAARARARAVPRSRARREPRLREGIHRPRLAAAAPRARRSRPRRWRRGDGRHPRRAALHAAHGRSGLARDDRLRVSGRWTRGATRARSWRASVPQAVSRAAIGDTFTSAEREVTIADIESFAALSGDTFYAHMDEAEARRNPLFGGRVAHGYFLISAAAGLFVDPPYGPVLANYGLDNLRFVKPVKPGDRIKVRLTCKAKSLRAERAMAKSPGTRRSRTRTARSSRATTC